MNAPVSIPTVLSAKASKPSGLLVGTTLVRDTEEFGPVDIDILICFEITHYIPGCPATWTDPAEGPEFEFAITSIEFDGGECDDAPGPITDAECATVTAWFEGDGHDKAYDRACDYDIDRSADYADWRRDQRQDEMMEGKFK